MLRKEQIKETLETLLEQKKALEEKEKEKGKLSAEIKSIKGKINWNQARLIDYLEENKIRKILIDNYSFSWRWKPVPDIKILKNVEDFPPEYIYYPAVNRVSILKTYHREEMDKLKGLVEMNQQKYIVIEKKKDATVTYSKSKDVKRLSTKGN